MGLIFPDVCQDFGATTEEFYGERDPKEPSLERVQRSTDRRTLLRVNQENQLYRKAGFRHDFADSLPLDSQIVKNPI